MAKVTCHYCKKEIEEDDAVAITNSSYFRKKPGEIVYFCQEHKGFKTESDFFWGLVQDILLEVYLDKDIVRKPLKKIVSQFGLNKVSHYLYENKDFINSVFNDKSKGFKTPFNKMRYLLKMLENNLPDYKIREDHKGDYMRLPTYNPKYDPTMNQQTVLCEPRRTIEDKINDISKAFEERPEPDMPIMFFSLWKREQQNTVSGEV